MNTPNIKDKELKVPVLLLIFNRLEPTQQVLNAIRKAKPNKLYIASDGSRLHRPDEQEKVQVVRDYVLGSIDWDCEVQTLFRKENLGCGRAVYEAIDWFFKNEEMGIILEDDVVPVQGFFRFCQELLEKYHYDERVAMISGNNHIGYRPENSYLFSKYKGCWGWGTWRRSWKNMDFEMRWLETTCRDKIIRNMGFSKISENYWRNAIDYIKSGRVNAWDWQWYFSIAANNQLCVFPSVNLVKNIGFGAEATHTFGKPKRAFIETEEMVFPLVHPEYVIPDTEHDKLFEDRKIKDDTLKRFIPIFLKNFIKNTLKLKKQHIK